MRSGSKKKFGIAVILTLSLASFVAAQQWEVRDVANEELPGRIIEVLADGTRVAGFIYGEGQMKTYLSVYDPDGNRLTNPGIDADGNTRGRFPHHRGIFIGWNRIRSNLGMDDLWHLRGNERMRVSEIKELEADSQGVRIVLDIEWLSSNRDDELEGLLISERREISISRTDGRTRIDHKSEMRAARDVNLGGDLQHAGLHFRADAAVDDVRSQTSYLWAPADLSPGRGRIISDDLLWVRFLFPLHDNWYSVTQLNHPDNRSTELSWRDYGRFGFFFNDELEAGEVREMVGRFYIDASAGPDAEDEDQVRAKADADYRAYVD